MRTREILLCIIIYTTAILQTSNAQEKTDGPVFAEYFTGNSMRYDFHHAGNCENEYYYFDKVVREGKWGLLQTN